VIAVYELYRTDTFDSDLKALDSKTKGALKKIIYRLIADPTRFKPLRGKTSHYRVRLGVYRMVYKIEGERITLMYVKKRDVVYAKI